MYDGDPRISRMRKSSSKKKRSSSVGYSYSYNSQNRIQDDSSVLATVHDMKSSTNCLCGGASSLEKELVDLRISTKQALQTSWNEVEILHKEKSVLEEELNILKLELQESRGREKKLQKKAEKMSCGSVASYGNAQVTKRQRPSFIASVSSLTMESFDSLSEKRNKLLGSKGDSFTSKSTNSELIVTFPNRESNRSLRQKIGSMDSMGEDVFSRGKKNIRDEYGLTKGEKNSSFRSTSSGSEESKGSRKSGILTWPSYTSRNKMTLRERLDSFSTIPTLEVDVGESESIISEEERMKDQEIQELKVKMRSKDNVINMMEEMISITIKNMQNTILTNSSR